MLNKHIAGVMWLAAGLSVARGSGSEGGGSAVGEGDFLESSSVDA